MDGHHRHAEYRELTAQQRLADQDQRGGTPDYGIARSTGVLQRKVNKCYAGAKQLHMLKPRLLARPPSAGNSPNLFSA